jgi:hypothetical protein
MARHLKTVHKWTSDDVKSSRKIRLKNPLRKCPYKSCSWSGVRFEHHFKSKHRLTKKDKPIR